IVTGGTNTIIPGPGLDNLQITGGTNTIVIRPGDVPALRQEIIACQAGDRIRFQSFPLRTPIPSNGSTTEDLSVVDPKTGGTYVIRANCATTAGNISR
ncbi:MAG: hypothetical protein NZ610_00050, partial [Candidatus Bipolaricaulota bacterium]|nr:hypothetical protein [Candidatus Bipolaricaulota bacterium]